MQTSTPRAFLLVSIALVQGWNALPSVAETLPNNDLSAAREALANGDLALAERSFRTILQQRPGELDAYRGLGETLAAQGRKTEAGQLYLNLGRGLLQSNQFLLAAEILVPAADLLANAEAFAQLGKARLFAQDPPGAVAPLRRAVELGGDVRTRLYLAAALWDTREFEAAEGVYLELLATRSTPVVEHQLGRLLSWQGRAAEAVPHLRRALQTAPSGDIELDLAQALVAAGELDEALAAFQRAATAMPRSFKARYGLARLHLQRGENEAARIEMAAYQQLYAEEQEKTRLQGLQRARLDHAWNLIEQSLFAEAAAELERQAAANGATVEVLGGLATAYSGLGRHGDAVNVLERAVSLDPERQDLRLMLSEERLKATGDGPR